MVAEGRTKQHDAETNNKIRQCGQVMGSGEAETTGASAETEVRTAAGLDAGSAVRGWEAEIGGEWKLPAEGWRQKHSTTTMSLRQER